MPSKYGSASEVVREALRLLEARDQAHEAKLAALRAVIQKGIDTGPAKPWEGTLAIIDKARSRRDDCRQVEQTP